MPNVEKSAFQNTLPLMGFLHSSKFEDFTIISIWVGWAHSRAVCSDGEFSMTRDVRKNKGREIGKRRVREKLDNLQIWQLVLHWSRTLAFEVEPLKDTIKQEDEAILSNLAPLQVKFKLFHMNRIAVAITTNKP